MLRLAALLSVVAVATVSPAVAAGCSSFGEPEPVGLHGYTGIAMEPFVTRDGRYLIFNDSNGPLRNTDLHYGERAGDGFHYIGRLTGANSTELDGVPSTDEHAHLYFVSMRSYGDTLSSIYRASFHDGRAHDVEVVPGISREIPGFINFDAEISADGSTMVFVDGFYAIPVPFPLIADLVLARRKGDGYARVEDSERLLAEVNTEALEYAPSLSRDELELLFTRATYVPGTTPRIYRSTRRSRSEPFGPPGLVEDLEGYVEAPALSPDGRFMYFHQQDGEEFHIYRARRCAA